MLSVRREERLQELAQSLGEGAAYLQSDVTQRKDMQRLAQVALARFGKIDALFANAEVMPGSNIRTTTIYPGAVKTELLHTIAPSREKAMVEQFYEEAGLEPDVIANAVLYALFQPDNVDVSDLVVRPSKES